jgi:DNA-binding GntR family transcriptional regulator
VIENVKPHLDRVRWLSMDLLRPLSRIVRQHEAIFDALKARDPHRAAESMRMHVNDFVGLLDPIAAHHPHLFEDEAAELDESGVAVVVRG